MSEKTLDILPNFFGAKPGALCFKTTGGHFEDVIMGVSALTQFYDRILLGASFPSKMILNSNQGIDTALALMLFLHPELALEPYTSTLVKNVDLYTRLGAVGLSVLHPHERALLQNVFECLATSQSKVSDQFQGLMQGASLFEQEVRLSSVPKDPAPFEVLDELGPYLRYTHPTPVFEHVYAEGYLGGLWCSEHTAIFFQRSEFVTQISLATLSKVLDTGPSRGVWRKLDANSLQITRKPTEEECEALWTALRKLLNGVEE